MVVAEVEEIVLWSLLYQDPLYELRVLASAAGTTPESIPGRLKPGEELEERARQLSPDENLRRDLATLGIDVAAFNTARQKVLGEAVCREALRATPPSFDPHRTALARAIVAWAIAEARQQGDFPADVLDGDARDAVVGLLSGALGNATLSIAGLVGMQLFGLAQRLGVMNHVQRSAAPSRTRATRLPATC